LLINTDLEYPEILLLVSSVDWSLINTSSRFEIHACDLSGISAFNFLCRGISSNKTINELWLTNCSLNDQNTNDLQLLLESNDSISALVIYGNDFGSNSLELLCKTIKSKKAIKKLDLSQKSMDKDSFNHIIDLLDSYQQLRGLALFAVNIDDDSAVKFTNVLKKSNLTSLNCLGSKMSLQTFHILTTALAFNRNIQELDLTDIEIETDLDYLPCQYVGELLQHNKSISKLVFENFDMQYMDLIIKGLEQNYYLTRFNQEEDDTELEELTIYTERNVKIQKRFGIELLITSRNLSTLGLPFDIQAIIFIMLCRSCLVHHSYDKMLKVLLFQDSIGEICTRNPFSTLELYDSCENFYQYNYN